MASWRDVREKYKTEDRYYAMYPERPESFWKTLDSRVVAWTYNVPILGGPLRLLLSILCATNRREPYPIGDSPRFGTMYDGGDAYRWFRWHIRNPWEDLRKYYLGFGGAAERGDVEEVVLFSGGELDSKDFWKITLWKAHVKGLPFPLLFPYYKIVKGNDRFLVGWKSRGIFGFTIDLD